VSYRLDVGGASVDVDVRASQEGDFARLLRDGDEYVGGPLGPGRIVLEDRSLVVTVFPNDLKLPELRHLIDPVKRRDLLRDMLPDRPELWEGELRCLGYRRQRRYTAELRSATGRAVLKSYTTKAYRHGKINALTFQTGGPLRIARLLGWSDGRQLLAFEWLPGRGLFDLGMPPEIEGEMTARAGAALATLHEQRPDGLECWTREDETASLLSLASEIGFLYPALAGRADELARRVAAQLAGAPDMHVAIHGDFNANQVLMAPSDVSIIDLDWACCADPADDLGNILAQAETLVMVGERPSAWIQGFRDALLAGYRLATKRLLPDRIDTYTARGLFRRARNPFRMRMPEWPTRMEALLARAEAMLNGSLHASDDRAA